jgi:acetyltransferase
MASIEYHDHNLKSLALLWPPTLSRTIEEHVMTHNAVALDYFFNPQGVAIIGASRNPAKLSHGVVKNLKTHGYRGPIYPVNPRGDEILGLKVYPSILDVPDPVELAVVMIPAGLVPTALEQCGQRGLKAVIIVTGGFRETGTEGAARERELKAIAERYKMRLMGPNCVGVMDAHLPLDTTFITMMPEPGAIAFVSHSGAICGGSIDWARSVGVGYSRIASLGNELDVDIADGIHMMADDPNTSVISVYAEGLPDGRDFVEVAASVFRRKPIVMLKAGLTSAGTRAVASHTGALAGSARAYQAASHRAGVLAVASLQEQNDVAMALATQPLPPGNRVALLTNAGGPAALAADALDKYGLQMADLTEATQARLRDVTPRDTQLGNPIDMLGGPQPEMYSAALRVLLEDPGVDMAMALFVPQAITPVDEVARHIIKAASASVGDLRRTERKTQREDKPIVACIVGGESIQETIRMLNRHGVPYYRDPHRASRALAGLWEYQQLRKRPDLTPRPLQDVDRAQALHMLKTGWAARQTGEQPVTHQFLDAETSAQVVAAYGIPIPASGLARTLEDAVSLAERIGFPVVMKLVAPDVIHKADVGGVALNLHTAQAVRDAFIHLGSEGGFGQRPCPTEDDGRRPCPTEDDGRRPCPTSVMVQQMMPQGQEVIVGAQRDAQFGPLLMFGMGGIYVEVLKDVAFRLAPLCERDARDMIMETSAGIWLQGVRGQPAGDIAAVVDVIQRLGQLVADFPCIAELDINPLIVGQAGTGAWAVDVRIALDRSPTLPR